MKITRVTYRRNAPSRHDQFQQHHAEISVEVEEGEDANEAFNYARSWVSSQLGRIWQEEGE